MSATFMALGQQPKLIRESIIQSMDIDALISASFSSEDAYNMIRMLIWRLENTTVNFQECYGRTYIQCSSVGFTEKMAQWQLIRTTEGNFTPKLRINSTVYDIREFDPAAQNTDSWNNEDYKKWFVTRSMRLFYDLFGRIRGIAVGMKWMQLRDIPYYTFPKHCVMLDEHASAIDITWFCDRFNGRTLIIDPIIRGVIEPNSNMMNISHLFIKDAPWFTGAHLQNFTGKNAFVFNAQIYTNDVVELVQQWLDGRNRRLRTVVIRPQSGIPFDPEDVKRSLKHQSRDWDPEERDRNFIFREDWKMHMLEPDVSLLDCSTGQDFYRESDGMLATLHMTNRTLCFFVWRNRFPHLGEDNY
ncbi:hypothetical protein B9Z55_025208 [Caenorhabditis nigoni]|uniref:F-box associated domain-containing protein n=1 Tax=Caenorhabditis nigoni TaxID=1611254 RepID=A0A2G5SY82_9PELO|nr:hypothetical protein B9Z55_025208 [Caenorhabditis nigoni]